MFNTEDAPAQIDFDLSRLNLGGRSVTVRDLWRRADLGQVRGSIRQALAPHGSALLRVSAR